MEGVTITFPGRSVMTSWSQDLNFNKMVAAIDMFLCYFPMSSESDLRIGTLGSRYKDCSAFLSVGLLTKTLGMKKESQLLNWIFTEGLAAEFKQMMKRDQECMKVHSYFPYQADFGLVRRSYYSATKNPQLFFLLHAVGTLLQSTRSKNAVMISEDNIVNNSTSAKWIAYIFAKNVELRKMFMKKGSDQRPKAQRKVLPLPTGMPRSKDAIEWFIYMRGCNFELPLPVVEFINHAKSLIGEVRPKTVGEHVKLYFSLSDVSSLCLSPIS
ncbi:hypothetical protein QAD02_015128 [Eretmocerus hayati]|uniref:Uncharacterized protein n=1 Tax=Eretmocerus hayati TaxID=131215 RepID=A0ACC2P7D8_9HYME|nr:hypothetical protein QAD02_015128 [Eretmocerus hayati]